MQFLRLLFSRRFGPIFTAMGLGAFNDNYYKNAFVILVTYRLAEQSHMQVGTLVSIGTASFIVPFFLFSGMAGILADKFSKSQLARILKLTELGLVCCAILALFDQHIPGMMVILCLLGLQAAFFGPVKYAILPELLREDELLRGNGLVEAGTFIFILLGTTLGGLLILHTYGIPLVAFSMLGVSLLGVIAAWYIPRTAPANAVLHLPRNPIGGLWNMVRITFVEREMLIPIIGISWFWAIGATYLTQMPIYARQILSGDEEVSTAFFALFSIGVAIGSVLCAGFAKKIPARILAPLSLLGVCVFGLDVTWIGYHNTPYMEGMPLLNLVAFLQSPLHWRIAADLFLMAACGGIFTIPLYTRLQLAAGKEKCARAIASNNVVNSIFIAGGSLTAAVAYKLGFGVLDILLFFGLTNIPMILFLIFGGVHHRPKP